MDKQRELTKSLKRQSDVSSLEMLRNILNGPNTCLHSNTNSIPPSPKLLISLQMNYGSSPLPVPSQMFSTWMPTLPTHLSRMPEPNFSLQTLKTKGMRHAPPLRSLSRRKPSIWTLKDQVVSLQP